MYLVLDAQRMNEDAADALLKDLEEPPPYATIVLVATELGPLPPTILSRCQLVPFRRLSERAVRAWIAERAPDRSEEEVSALARASAGRLDRARPAARPRGRRAARVARHRGSLGLCGSGVRAGSRGGVLLDAANAAGEEARQREQDALEGVDLPAREADQRVRRAQRGAEREELLASLEALRGVVPRPRRRRGRGGGGRSARRSAPAAS